MSVEQKRDAAVGMASPAYMLRANPEIGKQRDYIASLLHDIDWTGPATEKVSKLRVFVEIDKLVVTAFNCGRESAE